MLRSRVWLAGAPKVAQPLVRKQNARRYHASWFTTQARSLLTRWWKHHSGRYSCFSTKSIDVSTRVIYRTSLYRTRSCLRALNIVCLLNLTRKIISCFRYIAEFEFSISRRMSSKFRRLRHRRIRFRPSRVGSKVCLSKSCVSPVLNFLQS